MAAPVAIGSADALLVIDAQNDFCPGGALAVADGDQVVPAANRLAARFPHVLLTQDWHPPGHVSFASSHPGRKPYETIRLPYGEQVLWPDHCVQGTPGAELSPNLRLPHAALVIRKGHHHAVDSYSAFMEADGRTPTGLSGYLKERRIERLFLTGLATDFCVAWMALDGHKAGFEVAVVEDACRAIDLQGSLAKAWADMECAGVRRIRSAEIG
jgi:nicotinamidase/pyrazinamidase